VLTEGEFIVGGIFVSRERIVVGGNIEAPKICRREVEVVGLFALLVLKIERRGKIMEE
jgi:hypothetical protein